MVYDPEKEKAPPPLEVIGGVIVSPGTDIPWASACASDARTTSFTRVRPGAAIAPGRSPPGSFATPGAD